MTKDQPLVSVITVVYNGARFIEDTIASVLAQQGGGLEYWVIDGDSSDATPEIIARYAGKLAGSISEPDGGIADAFNKGIARARGDYLMFLNADDALAHPRAVADLIACAREHGWPDVIYGDCDLYDPDSGVFQYRFAVNYQRERFLHCEALPHPAMLMSRRYIERYGRFDLSFDVAMDYELLLRGVPDLGALRAPLLVTKVRIGGVSARSRGLVIEENIRALKMHGHLGALGEAWLRAHYAVRRVVRRVLEFTGMYYPLTAWRRRRGPSSS